MQRPRSNRLALLVKTTALIALISLAKFASCDPVTAPIEASAQLRDQVVNEQPSDKQAEPILAEQPQGDQFADSEVSQRRGRAEVAAAATAASSSESSSAAATEGKKAPVDSQSDKEKEKPKVSELSKTQQKSTAKPAASKIGSSSGSKSKNANLGTVTSTGSGGPTHYLSKHDAYSAIAEKHGAMAQEAMRKSDRRRLSSSSFGGIQKASGFGDVVGPLKGVGDTGLARTLGASMRSIMKSKYSVPAYVASALLGAVALMAFYESPISPLPVPPLPEPPVGRFPPELSILPPGTQVPFKTNQNNQYGYGNQRASYPMQAAASNQQPQQQQQVFFPSSQVAQQRSQSGSSSIRPVSQLAGQLLSSVSSIQQNAQRKSGPDSDSPIASSRNFFGAQTFGRLGGGSAQSATPKASSSSSQQAGSKASSFLSYFGFGNSQVPAQTSQFSPQQATGLQQASSNDLMSSQSSNQLDITPGQQILQQANGQGSLEAKGTVGGSSASSYPGASFVNRVRSYFSRPPSGTGSGSLASPSQSLNPSDQRPSFVQSLIKDTTFALPRFLSLASSATASNPQPNSNRKSSGGQPARSGASNSAAGNAAARMGSSGNIGDGLLSMGQYSNNLQKFQQQQQIQPAHQQQQQSSSALMKVAHALLESFTSGVSQRSPHTSAQPDAAASRKAGEEVNQAQQYQSSPLMVATSLFGDLVSNYGTLGGSERTQVEAKAPVVASDVTTDLTGGQVARSAPEARDFGAGDEATGGQHQQAKQSGDQNKVSQTQHAQAAPTNQQQQPSHANTGSQAVVASPIASSSPAVTSNGSSSVVSQTSHSRKTRSAGFEYPIESQQELALKESQVTQSRAAQINNVIDFVADSYSQNKLLFNFVMNQVGLKSAVPYVEQILAPGVAGNYS